MVTLPAQYGRPDPLTRSIAGGDGRMVSALTWNIFRCKEETRLAYWTPSNCSIRRAASRTWWPACPDGTIKYIDDPFVNLGEMLVDGINFGASYTTKEYGWGKIDLETDWTYLYNYAVQTSITIALSFQVSAQLVCNRAR